jgi:chorismate--pyruvate lyase
LSQEYSFPVGLQADWLSPEHLQPQQSSLNDWLLNTGSLTERLQANSTHFSVQVIGQQKLVPDASEARLLPDLHQREWQIREVVLFGDEQPWVYARSVLPDYLCSTTWAGLGSQPLGQRIFNDEQFVRSGFEIAQLNANPLNPPQQQALWARRSIFTIEEYHLLVAEVFLPDCPAYRSID